MPGVKFQIVEYDDTLHRNEVMELWQTEFGYEAARNAPDLVIDKKIQHNDALFFVARKDQKVIGTIMAGYDGHRGWIYSLAVHPDYRKQGYGSQLLLTAQEQLSRLGCLKINLQILAENEAVKQFYLANGYSVEPRISMGKKLFG